MDYSSSSTSASTLENLQLSLENLCLRNGNRVTASHGQEDERVCSSTLPLDGSLAGVMPSPGLSNTESFLNSSFGSMNLNGVAYQPYCLPENMCWESLNAGCGFPDAKPYLLFGDNNLFDFGNSWGNGINNIGITENCSGIRNEHNINGGILPTRDNKIISLAMQEAGSKYLQNLLKDPNYTKLIFEGVIEYIFQLITNQYGRYLFPKLITAAEEYQLRMIIQKLTDFSENNLIYKASIDRFGSSSIKKLIKVLEKSALVIEVVKALSYKFEELMLHATGRYVIMECLDDLDSHKNDLLYKAAIKNCLKVSVNQDGCVSMNNVISRIKGPRRDELLSHICDNVQFLAQDPSGNFVVQTVLKLQNPVLNEKICSNLEGYYVTLSMLKGGSHLVEKCLRSPGMEHVVNDLLKSNQLSQVVKDPFGNYVLQTALKETMERRSPLHESLVLKLQHLKTLRQGYGRNILALMTNSKPLEKAVA